jgi:tRNA-intron endonuclease
MSGNLKDEDKDKHDITNSCELPDNKNSLSDQSIIFEAHVYEKEEKIVVKEQKFQDSLRNKGFGELFNNEYVLDKLESLYLLQTNKINIHGKREYNFSSLLQLFLRNEKKILTKYLIYRDLRSKGYVVKEGFGFGSDFRVYERGEYGKKTSKYVTIGINEGINIKSKNFVETVEQIEKMGKNTVIAVIERRGEVIYYKTIKMAFLDNKKNQN